jgi:hypothetical protein
MTALLNTAPTLQEVVDRVNHWHRMQQEQRQITVKSAVAQSMLQSSGGKPLGKLASLAVAPSSSTGTGSGRGELQQLSDSADGMSLKLMFMVDWLLSL